MVWFTREQLASELEALMTRWNNADDGPIPQRECAYLLHRMKYVCGRLDVLDESKNNP